MNGVLLEINPDSDILVLSCSGIVPNDKIIYAMENSTKSINTNKLFICDKRSLWYYSGIEGLSSSFDDTVRMVSAIVSALKPARTCAIGTSGGGYMALALTSLLGLDRALAMSPQTFIGKRERAKFSDARWPSHMEAINKVARPYEIKRLVLRSKTSNFNVIYPRSDALDVLHAQRLLGLPNAELFGVNSSDHNVAAYLQGINVLQPCIDLFVASEDAKVAANLKDCLGAYT
jgi:hypothetical protein